MSNNMNLKYILFFLLFVYLAPANAQTINGTVQNIFVSHNSAFAIYINSSNNLVFYQNAINLVTTSFAIVVNTWYNVTIIYQPSSIGYLYVNNVFKTRILISKKW